MGEILLIIIAVILAASGDFTFFWIFAGLIALVLIGSLFGAGSGGSARHERPRTRIRIPGYIHPDYFRCSVCGSGFGADTMTCPHCGVRFNHTKTDERAFIEK